MWIDLDYKDIMPGRYEVSNKGKIRIKKNKKVLKGNNPKNEKGYVRIALKTVNGSSKKYPLHRLIINAFVGYSELEVDHLNGNKLDNSLDNLEYVTDLENKRRASVNGLYLHGEKHHKAVLTDDQVIKICSLFEQGVNVRKVQKLMDLDNTHDIDTMLTRILHRESWAHISKNYNWDIDSVRLKKYSKEDLSTISFLILFTDMSYNEIASEFSQYDKKKLVNVIKKMAEGRLYKNIIEEVRSSTTIEQL